MYHMKMKEILVRKNKQRQKTTLFSYFNPFFFFFFSFLATALNRFSQVLKQLQQLRENLVKFIYFSS